METECYPSSKLTRHIVNETNSTAFRKVAGQLADKPNRGQPNRGLVISRTLWSTRGLDNSRTIDSSRTGQVADTLVNSRTGQLADTAWG